MVMLGGSSAVGGMTLCQPQIQDSVKLGCCCPFLVFVVVVNKHHICLEYHMMYHI